VSRVARERRALEAVPASALLLAPLPAGEPRGIFGGSSWQLPSELMIVAPSSTP